MVAKVGDDEIHLSDLSEAAQTLPDEVRSMPPQVLYPDAAGPDGRPRSAGDPGQEGGVAKDPQVQRAIARATDQVLQNAVLSREIGPSVTRCGVEGQI